MQRINYAKTHDSDSTPHGSTARVHVSFATVEPGAADAALSSRACVSALPSGLSAAIATRCGEGVEALWICTMDCVAILGRARNLARVFCLQFFYAFYFWNILMFLRYSIMHFILYD